MICYENDCTTHLLEKKKEYFLKASKNYRKKKKQDEQFETLKEQKYFIKY